MIINAEPLTAVDLNRILSRAKARIQNKTKLQSIAEDVEFEEVPGEVLRCEEPQGTVDAR